MEENRIDLASEKYDHGYNCAQSVFCTYADAMGLDEATAYRIAEGFGGGMGGLRSTCGAVTAMLAVVSYLNSDGLLSEGKSKGQTYKRVKEAISQFEEEYSSVICKEILQSENQKGKRCEAKVADAVRIIEAMREGKDEE